MALKPQMMPFLNGGKEIAKLENGGVSFRLSTPDGQVEQTCFSVFSGVRMIFNDVHMPRNISGVGKSHGRIMEIDHCQEGRMECRTGGIRFYLAPGDVVIHRLGEDVQEELFPTSHYLGVTIQIDLELAPSFLTSILEDADVELTALDQKFRLGENFFFALRQLPVMEHIFSELYHVPDSIQAEYRKIKVLELLLVLKSLEVKVGFPEQRGISKTQVELAASVCDYLTEHLNERITTHALADRFQVSQSFVKLSFQNVYGVSVQSYVRSQRMRAAAKLLRETDRTVMDVAGEFGYANASKFSVAFRDVLGVTPKQYRAGIFHDLSPTQTLNRHGQME